MQQKDVLTGLGLLELGKTEGKLKEERIKRSKGRLKEGKRKMKEI